MKKFLLFSLLFSVVACFQLSAMDSSPSDFDSEIAKHLLDGVTEWDKESGSWVARIGENICFWRDGDDSVEIKMVDENRKPERKYGVLTIPMCRLLLFLEPIMKNGLSLIAWVYGGGLLEETKEE